MYVIRHRVSTTAADMKYPKPLLTASFPPRGKKPSKHFKKSDANCTLQEEKVFLKEHFDGTWLNYREHNGKQHRFVYYFYDSMSP